MLKRQCQERGVGVFGKVLFESRGGSLRGGVGSWEPTEAGALAQHPAARLPPARGLPASPPAALRPTPITHFCARHSALTNDFAAFLKKSPPKAGNEEFHLAPAASLERL